MSSLQGELGAIDNPLRFRDQDYQALLKACLKSRSLFSDPTFTTDQKSIGMPVDPDPKKAIKWLRPKVGYDTQSGALILLCHPVSYDHILHIFFKGGFSCVGVYNLYLGLETYCALMTRKRLCQGASINPYRGKARIV